MKQTINYSFILAIYLSPTMGGANQDEAPVESEKHCLAEFLTPPCDGAPGTCVFNSRSEKNGGFVAYSAHVEKNINGETVPYIGIGTQVCGEALVLNNAKIQNSAVISENATIRDNATVSDTAHVKGDANVFGDAKVSGDSVIFGNAHVGGFTVVAHGKVGGNAFYSRYARLLEPFTYVNEMPLVGRVLGAMFIYGVKERNFTLLDALIAQVGYNLPNVALDAILKQNALSTKLEKDFLTPNEGDKSKIVRLTEPAIRILIDTYSAVGKFSRAPIPVTGFDKFESHLVSLSSQPKIQEFFILKSAKGIHFQPVYVKKDDDNYYFLVMDSLARPDIFKNIKSALKGTSSEKIHIIFLNEARQYDPGTCSCFSLLDFVALQQITNPFEYFAAKAGAPMLDPASNMLYRPISIKDLPIEMLSLMQSLSNLRKLVLALPDQEAIWERINQTELFARDPRNPQVDKQMNGIVSKNFRLNETIIKSHLYLWETGQEITTNGLSFTHPLWGPAHLQIFANGPMRTQFENSLHYSRSFTYLDEYGKKNNASIDLTKMQFRVTVPGKKAYWTSAVTIPQADGTSLIVKLNPTQKNGIFIIRKQ